MAGKRFADNGQFAAEKWRLFLQWPVLRYLLNGLGSTLLVTAVSAGLAVPLGSLLALGRLSRIAALRWLSRAYIELFRSLPVLLVVYVFLIALPRAGLTFPIFWMLTIPIVLNNIAIIAELFRAGIVALNKGQAEAAYCCGMTYWQTMRLVVLPQAARNLSPALIVQLTRILKDSTLGYAVSYLELLYAGQVLGQYTLALVQTYLVVAVFFILANQGLSSLALSLERRLSRRQIRVNRQEGTT
jgi:glutamate transport system permease protein